MIWDVIVVGAGAAGLMTSIACGREGLKVLLLDGKEKIGAKILMSGGTRCNVTNQKVTENDFNGENKHAIRNILRAFSSEKAVRFFEEIGVHLIPEPGGKFFPSTHLAKTVLDAFLAEIKKQNVSLETGKKVTHIDQADKHFQVSGENFSYSSKTVVLTTGGLSYPSTGSDGGGFVIAKSLGHSLVPTTPALTPLTTDDADLKNLSGVSIPAKLMLFVDGKKDSEYVGSFLFTHFGFSGPAVLNISRNWVRQSAKAKKELTANFLPQFEMNEFEDIFLKHTEKHSSQSIHNALPKWLPERFSEVFLKKIQMGTTTPLNQLKRTDREKIVQSLFQFPLRVTGVLGYQKAEVTAGGVSFENVDSKTLESKLVPGLFFAGEILDVDGQIGGFNFQWAWSSGVVAAQGIIKILREDVVQH